MQDFLKQNIWNFVVTIVGISMGWAMLNARLTTVEAQAQENKQTIVQYSQLVERVVRLEENRAVVASDIKEIKDDLKDLKKHFNLQP